MTWGMAEVGQENIPPTVCQALDVYAHIIQFNLTLTIIAL